VPKATVRITLVVFLAAAFLVPDLVTPVRAVVTPRTLSARHAFRPGADRATLRMDIAATHGMLSWSGGERSGVKYRYTLRGETTRWRRAPHAHDMEQGNRHYSAPLLLARSRTIEWRAYGGARRVVLDYVNTLDGPRRRTEIPAVANAYASTPDIVTRAEWGADESLKRSTGGCQRVFYDPQQIFVHHTVTTNNDRNPAATVRAIYHFHTASRGWCDIGYNFLVSADGKVFEGRWARSYAPWEVHDGEDTAGRVAVGAHTADFNSGSIGVSVLGNYQSASLRPAGRRALIRFLSWEADRHDLDPTGWHRYRNPSDGLRRTLPFIAGHRDGGQTSCPGRYLYSALPSLRRAVKKVVGRGKDLSVVASGQNEPVTYGEGAPARFRLTTAGGRPLADKRIAFYKRGAGGWRFAGEARTGDKGWARLALALSRNVKIAGVWSGNRYRWGDDAFGTQRVRPLVTVVPVGGLETAPGTYEFPQGTSEIEFGGEVAPDHGGRRVLIRRWQQGPEGTFVRLEDRRPRLDDASLYRSTLTVPPQGGTYKLVTIFAAHDDHAGGRSRVVYLVIPPAIIPPDP
jgi:hypothetical protein